MDGASLDTSSSFSLGIRNGETQDAVKQEDSGIITTRIENPRPVLLSVGGVRTRKLSGRNIRQNVNVADADNGGEASKSFQLWQKLQEEREMHQQAKQREEQLQTEVKALQELLERNGIEKHNTVPLEESDSFLEVKSLTEALSTNQRLLQSANQRTDEQERQLSQKNLIIEQLRETLTKQSEEIQHHLLQMQSLNHLHSIALTQVKEDKENMSKDFNEKLNLLASEVQNYEKIIKEKEEHLFEQREINNSLKQNFEVGVREKMNLIVDRDAKINQVQLALDEQIRKCMSLEEHLLQHSEEFNIPEHKVQILSLEEQLTMIYNQLEEQKTNSKESEHKLLIVINELKERVNMLEMQLKQKTQMLGERDEQLSRINSELQLKNDRLQFIEEKVNLFDENLTDQVQELQEQVILNERLQIIIDENEDEIELLNEKVHEQKSEADETLEKFQLLDMLHEEEIQLKDTAILNKTNEIMKLENTMKKKDDESERLMQENVIFKERLNEGSLKINIQEDHVKALIKFCQNLLEDQESLLKIQYTLKTEIKEQLKRIESYKIDNSSLSKELEENNKLSDVLGLSEMKVLALQEEIEVCTTKYLDLIENYKQNELERRCVDEAVKRLSEEINVLNVKSSDLQVQFEESNQILKERESELTDKNKELQDIRIVIEKQLFEKYDQAKQIEDLQAAVDETKKENLQQEETLQKQDKCIQRLQEQLVQLEQDIQVQQQDALKQQQDSIDEYLLEKEVLEEQLLKQNVLLDQQDVKLHEYDEHVQHIHKTRTFYTWGLKKK